MLKQLVDPVIVPDAVSEEFGPLPDWIEVRTPADSGMVAALRLVVDPGESEAIALAYESSCRIILDDRKAREAARHLGIAVTGTVGLLLKAKEYGMIPTVLPLLDALDASGFRISEAIRKEALRLAGE